MLIGRIDPRLRKFDVGDRSQRRLAPKEPVQAKGRAAAFARGVCPRLVVHEGQHYESVCSWLCGQAFQEVECSTSLQQRDVICPLEPAVRERFPLEHGPIQ